MKQTVLLLMFVVLFIGKIPAQTIDLVLSPRLEMAHVVYLSDFAFIEKQNAAALQSQFLFQVTFSGFSGQEGKLIFEIRLNSNILAKAVSNTFAMPAEGISVNNMQLMDGVPIGLQQVRFEDRNIQDLEDDFQNEILGSNKLPRGLYVFRIAFVNATAEDEVIASDEKRIEIYNPTYVVPVTPGTPAGIGIPEIIFTDMPTFIFDSDLLDPMALDTNPFTIQVFQKLDQHTSPDEATTGTPHLEAEINTMVVNYSAFPDAEPLEPGTYLWRVLMKIPTSGGEDVTTSPLYAFKVRDINDQGNPEEEAAEEDIYELLKSIVGAERAKAISQQLTGYHLSAIRLNGSLISVNDLYDIIDNYQGHLVEITDLILQSTQN